MKKAGILISSTLGVLIVIVALSYHSLAIVKVVNDSTEQAYTFSLSYPQSVSQPKLLNAGQSGYFTFKPKGEGALSLSITLNDKNICEHVIDYTGMGLEVNYVISVQSCQEIEVKMFEKLSTKPTVLSNIN